MIFLCLIKLNPKHLHRLYSNRCSFNTSFTSCPPALPFAHIGNILLFPFQHPDLTNVYAWPPPKVSLSNHGVLTRQRETMLTAGLLWTPEGPYCRLLVHYG